MAYNFVPIVLSSLLILQTGNLILNVCLTCMYRNLNGMTLDMKYTLKNVISAVKIFSSYGVGSSTSAAKPGKYSSLPSQDGLADYQEGLILPPVTENRRIQYDAGYYRGRGKRMDYPSWFSKRKPSWQSLSRQRKADTYYEWDLATPKTTKDPWRGYARLDVPSFG